MQLGLRMHWYVKCLGRWDIFSCLGYLAATDSVFNTFFFINSFSVREIVTGLLSRFPFPTSFCHSLSWWRKMPRGGEVFGLSSINHKFVRLVNGGSQTSTTMLAEGARFAQCHNMALTNINVCNFHDFHCGWFPPMSQYGRRMESNSGEGACCTAPALKLGHPPQEPVPQVTHHAQANLFERGF